MTQRLSLYELSEEARALDALTAMEDGEFTPEIEQLHEELMQKLVAKADAFGAYLKELQATDEAITAEIDRLTDRRKRLRSRIEWMKGYAVTALLRMQTPTLKGDLFTLRAQKNPDKVDVMVLPDALPAPYVRVIPEQREPDRKALLEAVKRGEEIPGVALAAPSYHLRVQ